MGANLTNPPKVILKENDGWMAVVSARFPTMPKLGIESRPLSLLVVAETGRKNVLSIAEAVLCHVEQRSYCKASRLFWPGTNLWRSPELAFVNIGRPRFQKCEKEPLDNEDRWLRARPCMGMLSNCRRDWTILFSETWPSALEFAIVAKRTWIIWRSRCVTALTSPRST